ncbi:hypothetical protein CHLRE_03g194450v5 [Chlamydomonas reinhardtii]|uniref:Protein NEOXANTHIN-DEFICIENT 1 n=1 Tax=Chlamydomonas reinhardtii TaxID=3055 RepID=A0A2K3DYJ1_CHLRE|nr:uncharacterized protein CHLRE_03g194450v5 [Chlamydomonas reinhardtii]PNW85602.1 hypothetical protein CHLRE_03g194450v5 [Chlamydomonas reinhardtii]
MVYKEAPWVFKGKALYQLQLVKSDEARKYVPDKFKLVELFGYTLGGFYLARYEDSPAGTFDEMVAMAGLVWNPPTSCAWAARVFVNNREARDHGVHHVGLPSRLGAFSLLPAASGAAATERRNGGNWWLPTAPGGKHPAAVPGGVLELRNADTGRGRGLSTPVCLIELPAAQRSLGPRITLSLPSFSGGTPEVPGLLRYACDLTTNVGLVPPLRVTVPPAARGEEESPEQLGAVLGGRPLLCIEFAQMEMRVEEPEALVLASTSQAGTASGWATARTAASVTAAWGSRA